MNQTLYMLVVDGATYFATKWGLDYFDIDRTIDDAIDLSGSIPRESHFNSTVMFVASKWLYQNYVYDLLMGIMPADGFIGVRSVRDTLGITITMTIIRAFQGKANMRTFLNDFVAVGAADLVNEYLTPYITSMGSGAKDIIYNDVQSGGEGTKPQNVATHNESGRERRVLLL